MSKWLLTILAGLVIAIGLAFSSFQIWNDRTGPDGTREEDDDTAEAVAPPSAELPQTSAPLRDEVRGPDQAGRQQPAIHETAYAFLAQFGQEKDGYGLYSYVLFPHPSARARAFAETLFATTGAAAESLIAPENINILALVGFQGGDGGT
jgi:hypothetical protein